MSRSISREDFNEFKNYLGVYFQQGKAILDSDLNENQDIAVSFLRRLNREALGEGSPNTGFNILPVLPLPLPETPFLHRDKKELEEFLFIMDIMPNFLRLLYFHFFGAIPFFLNFPGKELDNMESLQGFALDSPQGKLRISRDRPYSGNAFLRLSGHSGTVRITRTLSENEKLDLSTHELLTFRYRINEPVPGIIKFFLEDGEGNRSVWLVDIPVIGSELWLAGFAAPLDLSFRLVSSEVMPAVVGVESTMMVLTAIGGKAPMVWSAKELPDGLVIDPVEPVALGDESRTALIRGRPSKAGDHTFTVEVTNANNNKHSENLTLKILAKGEPRVFLPNASQGLGRLQKFELPTGRPADLKNVRKYGFEVYQDQDRPLVWEFDDLRLGSSELQESMVKNNFIIQGSGVSQFLNQLSLFRTYQSAIRRRDADGGIADKLTQDLEDKLTQELVKANPQFSEPDIQSAGRFYVAGLPCVQVHDVLYSQQADPNDPLLAPPPPGVVRKDTVYLDVWTEPVTYVEDPEIREIALGGPDTSTRLRLRHRVRVAQGGDVPTGHGVGLGTLATEGNYTAQANRLYRVEIDTAGDIGTATFRWSEDNASTLQRVIEPIPPGSNKVTVEDASAFHSGDWILIRKEFGEERHRITTVFGNVITLQDATGAQLALLPAANRVPDFTTFSLADRPMIQRWNEFKVPVQPDPEDEMISGAIALNDGVKVRFGGRAMHKGDYWSFKTRYLAGDEASGINAETRIEQLSFQRARGVVHHYVPLATCIRDGSNNKPDHISQIQDRRKRAVNAGMAGDDLESVKLTSQGIDVHLGGVAFPLASADSSSVIFLSGNLSIIGTSSTPMSLSFTLSFYSDEMTDPKTERSRGIIEEEIFSMDLTRQMEGIHTQLQFTHIMRKRPILSMLPSRIPTSVQVFARALGAPHVNVRLGDMQVTVLELKEP